MSQTAAPLCRDGNWQTYRLANQYLTLESTVTEQVYQLKAGYRYLNQDYGNDGFVRDMVASGFYFGTGFRFRGRHRSSSLVDLISIKVLRFGLLDNVNCQRLNPN